MIEQSQVDEVKRLLATEKYSLRKIAALTKVSRGIVTRIAKGERRDRQPVKKVEELGPFDGPIERCPDCGGLVHMPCRYCQAVRFAAESEEDFSAVDLEATEGMTLGLELEGECLQRYEEIHQKRLQKGEPVSLEYGDTEEADDDFFPEMYFTSMLSRECMDTLAL